MRMSFCLVLLLATAFVQGQAPTRKERKVFAAQAERYRAQIQEDVNVLASDSMEGRRAGTPGEQKAIRYLSRRWKSIGLAPAGTQGEYEQPFRIAEGLQLPPAENSLRVNGIPLRLMEDYYPMSWSSPDAAAEGEAALSLPERGIPWFLNVHEWLEANAGNPHYQLRLAVQAEALRAKKKGATALLVYNSSSAEDNLIFARFDTLECPFPVLYLTRSGMKAFADSTASYHLQLKVRFRPSYRHASNLVAFIDNKAPSTIVLGAHYDHLGFGEDKNSLDGAGEIHNGADDNASGTAALTLLGQELKNDPAARGHNYLLIAFSAEELGLLGSRHWLDSPTLRTRIGAMINMDMVGRYRPEKKLTVGGYGTSPAWAEAVRKANTPLLNLELNTDSSGSGPSDHASFYRRQIPVLFLFTNAHSDYHKATDDAGLINAEGTARIVIFTRQLLQQLSATEILPFTPTAEKNMGRSSGFTVSLGVIPDYAYAGNGVRIDGVSKGKLAEKLGLQAGDILVQLGDHKFADVQGYMQVLGRFRKGDATRLVIRRGTEEKQYDLIF